MTTDMAAMPKTHCGFDEQPTQVKIKAHRADLARRRAARPAAAAVMMMLESVTRQRPVEMIPLDNPVINSEVLLTATC
jgi:hypothetical protein